MIRLWHTRRRGVTTILTVMAIVGFGLAGLRWSWPASPPEHFKKGRASVRRSDLFTSMTAPGRVESARNTLVECELENLAFSSEGRTVAAGGNSTILEIVPDGSNVHRDDVLARLDSSDYEELVRQQEIKVLQTRSDHRVAELDLEAAEIALVESAKGLLPQQDQGLRGDIILSEADLQRQMDRVKWARKMLSSGYVSAGLLISEEDSLLKAQIKMKDLTGERRLFEEFTAPSTLRRLQLTVDTLRSTLLFQEFRLRRHEMQLDKFRKQVAACTIRAPHDGFVIYANEPDGDPRVEVGARVYQKMDLFYLPDLANMEVLATIHESLIDRVKGGMSVRVRIEAIPDYQVEGRVLGVEQLPMVKWDSSWSTVKSYLGRVRIDTPPPGLKPGMTAEVEIQTGHAPGSLVVPNEAVVVENDHDYCYVVGAGGLERREVTLGMGTKDLLEIKSGLEEGEQVVLDPTSGK